MKDIQHVFLIGAKSLGAYGGYETFINKLTEYHKNDNRIQYHVACKANGNGSMDPYKTEGVQVLNDKEFMYHNAHCFRIRIPEKIGSAQAIYYDYYSLKTTIEIIKKEEIQNPIVYIMACRIGLFIKKYYYEIKKLGGKVYLNPDGHEWKRAKWSPLVRKYWRLSERIMVKYSDLVVCDSLNIEKYIHNSYDGRGMNRSNPKTTFIAYGTETRKSILTDNEPRFIEWLKKNELVCDEYYLAVGRFVPENNYEAIIREFMKSNSTKKFAIITNANKKFYNILNRKLHFENDKRICFAGTVYDTELLMKIRENAYGYLHGHEVGGTNPSLIEALGSTRLNLLLDVGFNQEVALDTALYWGKNEGNLANLINRTDQMKINQIIQYGNLAKARVRAAYSWKYICKRYAEVFYNTKQG